MQYLKSWLGAAQEEQAKQQITAEQQEFLDHLQQSEGVCRYLGQETIMDLMTLNASQVDYCRVVKKRQNGEVIGQEKRTEVLRSNVIFRIQDDYEVNPSTGEKSLVQMPVISIENVEYDEDQGQDQELYIPINQQLVLAAYHDEEDEKECLVFFYPHLDETIVLEFYEENEGFESLKLAACLLIYAYKKRKDPFEQKESKESLLKLCIQLSMDVIYNSPSLHFLMPKEKEQKPIVKDELEKLVEEKKEVLQLAQLVQQLSLQEQKPYNEIKVEIESRLLQVKGNLFWFDADEAKQHPLNNGDSCFLCIDRLMQKDRILYGITITDLAQEISYQQIPVLPSTEQSFSYSKVERLFMWTKESHGEMLVYSFLIDESDEILNQMQGVITKVVFETNMQKDFSAVEQDDHRYLQSYAVDDQQDDVDMEGVEKIEDFDFDELELEAALRDSDEEEEKKESDVYKELGKQRLGFQFGDDDDEEADDFDNKEAIQAHSYDRTFVVSGPVVKVYKSAEEQSDNKRRAVKFDQALPKLKNSSGQVIRPNNVMLYDQESRLVFTDEKDTSQLYEFDLESGKIVENYQAHKEFDFAQMRHISNSIKNGQAQPGKTYVGVNQKAIFTMDSRDKLKTVQEKIYKTNYEFNQVSTTLQGGLAVGSLNGEIRLYKEVGQNAKTLLPGLGDPIRAIDMSIDGNWIVATCQTYLLLIPTLCENGKTGFEHRMGKEKPEPKKLQINVKDLAKYKIRSVDFTPARFNNFNVSGGEHTSIVTSTGNILITWNFKKVAQGMLKAYKIQKLPAKGRKAAELVDTQFQFNDDERILVTEKQELGVSTRSKKVKIHY